VLLSKHYLTGHESGIYAAGAVLGRVIYFLGATVAAVMFPEVTLRHSRGEAHFVVVEKSLVLLVALSSAFVLSYSVIPLIVIGPFGAAFAGVGPNLVFFATALSFFSISVLFVNYFLSIRSWRFALPLLGACLLETLLIASFHSSAHQIVLMMLASMAALLGMLSLLYISDRLGIRVRPR
jgi:O-antigen/teichoic acid export membrane protein